MKSLKSIVALALLLCTTATYAQEEIIIIDRDDIKRTRREREIKLNDNIQIVKFAPLNLLAGEINFGYERKIGQKGSVDFELGPTISKIGFGIDSHIGNQYEPQVDDLSGLGFVSAIGFRYYPLDETEALNRFYVSPVFRFKLMNHRVQDFSNFLPDIKKGQESRTNFLFNFGYTFWPSKTFNIDVFTGIGIGMHIQRDWYAEYVFENNDWVYRWAEEYRSGARYVFYSGIKLGIGSK